MPAAGVELGAPAGDDFDAVMHEMARPRDLTVALRRAGLPVELAAAAGDQDRDGDLRAEAEEAVSRCGGGVGTPILSFSPPDGPALFGPVVDSVPGGDEALRLWDAVSTLARVRRAQEQPALVPGHPALDQAGPHRHPGPLTGSAGQRRGSRAGPWWRRRPLGQAGQDRRGGPDTCARRDRGRRAGCQSPRPTAC